MNLRVALVFLSLVGYDAYQTRRIWKLEQDNQALVQAVATLVRSVALTQENQILASTALKEHLQDGRPGIQPLLQK